ncbi:MAG: universal stress protein [Caenispirillum bisanense]|uniref:Universal stress protein family protein n=1 Tax=Caenispirillum bisanense TaxID=414052 RepID=A0A286G342_9PROT|nr:universal stress protein [Caenispirillum bisanense]MCA1940747.1 universal stress protein [Caenispirillum bisanense]MCA1973278.1 universal stress protein [Caenispirillum sp.]SOD89977.1 Universal stress protein family protein [Caenispirillum bisanense]
MALKDIMVLVDSSAHSADRLDVAIKLATDHDAHLTGLFVRMVPHVPQFVMSQLGPEVQDVQRKYAQDAARAAHKIFEDKVRAAGIRAEWRAVEGDLVDTVCLHAKYTDLVVMGQRDTSDDAMDGEDGLVDHVVLEAGRPVLVVPYAGKFKTIGSKVVLAWNASREATRAVNDAMPLLQKAREVEVLAINPRGGRAGHGDVPGADISLHLARHGVKANAEHIFSDDVDPGAMLLSRAADAGADLIVMGAYGRSRLRELVLGGATRHLLRHMTVPVLMAH